jgi:hypothetical protein
VVVRKAAAPKKKKKTSVKGGPEEEDDDEEPESTERGGLPQQAAAPPPAVVSPPRKRSRPLREAGKPVAWSKDVVDCGVLVCSPDGTQRCLIASCVKKRLVCLYSMDSLLSAVGPVHASSTIAFGDDTPITIRAAGFDPSGTMVALGDVERDNIHIFRIQSSGTAALVCTEKLCKGLFVTSLCWITPLPSNTLLLFQRNGVILAQHGGKCIGKDQFKLGDARGTAHSSRFFAAAGSVMSETRIGEVAVRADHTSFALQRTMALKTKRVCAVALNWSSTRAVVVEETGDVVVFDLDVRYSQGEDPRELLRFQDPDYTASSIQVSPCGNFIVLCEGADFTAYQLAKDGRSLASPPMDFHNTHDQRICAMALLHRGGSQQTGPAVLVTAGEEAAGLRCWRMAF